jgi:hypothetical protein
VRTVARARQGAAREAADASVGGQLAGRFERVQAVGGQLLVWDVAPYLAGRGGLGHQIPDEGVELLARLGDVLAPVHARA